MVGPVGYTFRYAPNVIRTSEIPLGFAAVLAGHIHRFQVLKKDLKGKISAQARAVIRAPSLRELAPKTMNIDAILVDYR